MQIMANSTEEGFAKVKQAVYESVRAVVKAKLMEAVAGYAASIFKSVPFPFNIAAAALSGVVVGGLFDSIMPALADGGLAVGATMAIVGEGKGTTKTNPEVIAPLDKLKGMIGNTGTGRLHGRISGSDILLSNSRSTMSQDRVSGSATNF